MTVALPVPGIDLIGVDHLVADPDRRLPEACKRAGLRRFYRRTEGRLEVEVVEGAFFHDIQDPWKFVRHALNDELRSCNGATLDPDRYEECVAFLVEKLCRLAERYRPGQSSLSFSSLAYKVVRRRYTDFLREWRGDSRYGTWSGGELECQHARLRDESTGRYVDPGRCKCGAQWVGNDGREQTVGELPVAPGASSIDSESLQALIDQLDHDKLSPRARGTLNEIVRPMLEEGLNHTEIAARLSKSRREVTRDMDRLRLELQGMMH